MAQCRMHGSSGDTQASGTTILVLIAAATRQLPYHHGTLLPHTSVEPMTLMVALDVCGWHCLIARPGASLSAPRSQYASREHCAFSSGHSTRQARVNESENPHVGLCEFHPPQPLLALAHSRMQEANRVPPGIICTGCVAGPERFAWWRGVYKVNRATMRCGGWRDPCYGPFCVLMGAIHSHHAALGKKIQLQSTGSRAGEGGSEQLGATVSASAKKQSFTFSKGYDIWLAGLEKCGP